MDVGTDKKQRLTLPSKRALSQAGGRFYYLVVVAAVGVWKSASLMSKGCGRVKNSLIVFHAFHRFSLPRPASIANTLRPLLHSLSQTELG
jgi:hypothetical protein